MGDRKAIIEAFSKEAEAAAGANLRALLLYGSAVTGGFVDGKSDYNFVIVADPIEIPLLDRLSTWTGTWRKRRIPVPLVFTPQFLERARDSYPLELLSMLAGYQVLRGVDALNGVFLEKPHVRLQCERELRAKTLHLRQAYVESGRNFRALRGLLGAAQPGVLAILRGLLFITDGPWRAHGPELQAALVEGLQFPERLLALLIRIRHDVTISSGEATELVHGLMPELERWTARVDQH